MTTIRLVRHGRAAAGWDTDVDPGLDELGRSQAEAVAARLAGLGPLPILSSPLRRCQETSAALAARWGVPVTIETAVAEIPSPDGYSMVDRLEWLRSAMQGTWTELGGRYAAFRDGVVARLLACDEDTVIFSHFVAINVAIGAALGDDHVLIRRLDNCSVTTIDVHAGKLVLVEGGHEADTLIR